MADNPIKYSDLISPDDSIEKLIGQLEQLNEVYTGMANNVRQQSQTLVVSLQKISGTTEAGRRATKQADEEAQRLEKAYKQLDAALSENAKQIARLNAVKREANNYNKQMVLRGKEEISTLQQIKEASYQQLSAQYALNKAYINTLSATDRNIKKNRELIETTKEIYEQMKKLQADTGKMQLNVGNYPNIDTKSILGSVVGITGVTGATIAAVNALKNGISTTMEYEHALSGLAAILGTTKDNIAELSSQARNLGATTIFTASEVVQLQTELAKLGYTTKEITMMAPGVLSFAQATGSSLADAASLTGAALRMFEKDASATQEFVDKMTTSTTKSALSFNYLANALSTVGPVANSFGFKIEDVLALLGQLANAGFDASSAATATRNILLNLADSSGKLAVALGKPVTNLDELISGLKSLNDRGIDLAESLDLTDKRSVAAFNTFLKGTDAVLGLRDALVDCDGAAEDMAKTMGDDLAGDLKTLQSAWEDLMIAINNGQGIIRSGVQWLTKLVRSWRDYLNLGDVDVFWNKKGDEYEKQEEERRKREEKREKDWQKTLAFRNPDGSQPLVIGSGVGDEETGTRKTSGTKPLSKKEQKAAEKARKERERQQKELLKEQEKEQKTALELRRKYEDATLDLIDDASTKERAKIIFKYDREIEDLRLKQEKDVKNKEQYDKLIVALEQSKQMKLADLFDKSVKEDEKQRKESLQKEEKQINAEYNTRKNEIELLEISEKEKTRMRLEAEKERLQKLLKLYQANGKKLTEAELKNIQSQIDVIDNELKKNENNRDIYDLLGFNLSEERKQAISESFAFAIQQLKDYINAWVQAAERKVQLADKEVESAQKALDAEREARANGYASNVEYAQKELQMAKQNQQKALNEQKKAQRTQEMIDAATQVSSLVTATANIWKTFSSMGPYGVVAALAASALMWGSFAYAKIKAVQMTKQSSETYGEGTVELLQGGSHQSGNDIDLGRKKDGTRRRAEGGEFFAVINKRNSRKYRDIIPDVMHAFNNGTFEQKYAEAYRGAGDIQLTASPQADLGSLKSDVTAIREQGERSTYTDGRGTHVVYKNLHRIILN